MIERVGGLNWYKCIAMKTHLSTMRPKGRRKNKNKPKLIHYHEKKEMFTCVAKGRIKESTRNEAGLM